MPENQTTSNDEITAFARNDDNGNHYEMPEASSSKQRRQSSFKSMSFTYSNRKRDADGPNDVELQTQRLLTDDHPPLAELFDYYMSQGLPTISKGDLFKLTFSALIGGLSLILYYDPTRKFAGDTLLAIIAFELSVLYANFGVSAFTASESCDTFLNNIPQKLAEKINSEAKKGKKIAILRQAGAMIFSAISAAPFAFATSGPFLSKALVELTNAVTNYYGINSIMFKNVEWLRRKLTRDQGLRNYYKILDGFEHAFNTVIQNAIEERNIPGKLFNIQSSSSTEKFKALLSVIDDTTIPGVKVSSWPKLTARSLTALTGSIVVLGGLLGYFFKLHQELSDKFSSNYNINIPLTLFFSVSYSYLAVAFGGLAFGNIYDMISGDYEKSHAMALHPNITKAAHLLTLIIVSGSFATSVYFINTSPYFNGDGLFSAYKPLFLILAGTSAFIFNQYANHLFVPKIIQAVIRYWGPQRERELASFVYQMEAFMATASRDVEPPIFVDGMMKLAKENQRDKILPTLSFQEVAAGLKEGKDKGKGRGLDQEHNNSLQPGSYSHGFFKRVTTAIKNTVPGLSSHNQSYQPVIDPGTTSNEETSLQDRKWGERCSCNIL
jgi:hypothetical protein